MTDNIVPKKGLLSRKAQVTLKCTKQEAFDYISSSDKLSEWLKKSGPVPGVTSVEILEGPYDHVGAKRLIHFQGGDTAEEQLVAFNPPGNYTYRINHFSNFLEKVSGEAYGQLWFDNENDQTRITWEYSFKYKSFMSRITLSLFLTFVYKKFMKAGLQNAKIELEK